jgi:cytochrome c-type biogenesis protein CcmE
MKATLIAVVVAIAGLGTAIVAFVGNASPYVTVAEASKNRADGLHLAGDIVPGTMSTDRGAMLVRFQVRDEAGDTAWVRYEGLPPANMGQATKVVAVGTMREGEFHSRKLLLKCPSKYESTKAGA